MPKKEVNIAVSQTKAQQFGLSTAQIQTAVRSWIWKENLGDLRFDNVVYKTTLQLAEHHKNSLEQLGRIPIQSPTGQTVYLNEVADIKEVQARVALNREDLKQHVKITASIKSENKAAVSIQVSTELAKLQLPEGVNTQVSGVTDDIMKSFTEMFVAMGIAIGIVYLIMVLAFGNASTPFAILFSLPLAVIGGLIGLLITSETLNVTTLIGFMMLIGIVITNAIVLLDRAQQLLHEGMTVRNAIVEAGMVRLRPIIMTAGATVAAMLPLAIGLFHSDSGGASLVSKGLAIVVIGGLISSTLLTLVVVPVIYETLELWKTKLSDWSNRDRKSAKKKPRWKYKKGEQSIMNRKARPFHYKLKIVTLLVAAAILAAGCTNVPAAETQNAAAEQNATKQVKIEQVARHSMGDPREQIGEVAAA